MKKLIFTAFCIVCFFVNLTVAGEMIKTKVRYEGNVDLFTKIYNYIPDRNLEKKLSHFLTELLKTHQNGKLLEFENLVKQNKELLDTPVNYKVDDNTTIKLRPLDWILMSQYNENSFKIIEILLQNGANINTYYQDDPKNFTIFYMLVLNNKIPNQDKVRLAELFVKYGADVNLVKKTR